MQVNIAELERKKDMAAKGTIKQERRKIVAYRIKMSITKGLRNKKTEKEKEDMKKK